MIVWLSSYPRSGNTFTRTLIKRCLGYNTYSIYNDSDIGGDAALTDLTGHKKLSSTFGQSDFDLSEMRASEELYFLKTHEPDRSLVMPEDKVIYLVRDPSKTALSFQQYLRDYHSIEATFGEIIMGKVFPDKGWAEHVRNWCASGHANTLLVKFEDLTSEPLAAIKRIAKFADLNVVNENIPSFEELNGVSPKFFARGSSRGKDTSISQPDIALMVLAGSGEMSEHGYAETAGDLVDGVDVRKITILTNAFWRVVGMERKEAEQLRSELSKATKRAVKSESHIEKTTDILNSMTGQLNEAQTQQAAVLEKLEASNRELSSSRMTVVEQERQVADLTNSNESLTEKLSEQEATNKELESQRTGLLAELAELNKNYEHVNAEYRGAFENSEKLGGMVASAERRILTLKESTEIKSNVISKLLSSVGQKEALISKLHTENSRLKQENASSRAEMEAVRELFEKSAQRNAQRYDHLDGVGSNGLIHKFRRLLHSFTIRRHIRRIRNSEYFNGEWYLQKYPDLKASSVDPAVHYFKYGGREGRAASLDFCSQSYLLKYPDVRVSNLNPLLHYINRGKEEGRTAFPVREAAGDDSEEK